MIIQVLSISNLESGEGRNGNKWFRRTFQVFDPNNQVAGNIPVYDDEEKLNSYKAGGKYEASVGARAGQNGRLELIFTGLEPIKQ